MKPVDVRSDEGRALSVILMMLQPEGRSAIRKRLLEDAENDESRHTLNLLNTWERMYDEMKRTCFEAEGVTP